MSLTMSTERERFIERIMSMPVLDTHTHLVGDRLQAKDFWEIAHYFWFFRELQAGGYPANAAELPEDVRIREFLKAYKRTQNTLMNWVCTQIFSQLYGVKITDEASVLAADKAVKASHEDPNWAQTVADKLNIKRFVVNIAEHASFQGMREDAILMPRIDSRMGPWLDRIEASANPAETFNEVVGEIRILFETYRSMGCPGIMTTLPQYEASANVKVPIQKGNRRDENMMMLLHEVCASAEKNGLLVQLFLGIERSWCGEAFPANDTARILKLASLFETYKCQFELVVASELNNLDVVQAAWNFPNVHIGGMWWFNFRASTYRDAMQYRLEALPSMKSSLIVSDARCMEWSFGKIVLVKRLAGEFLWKQMQDGWLDEELALYTADAWLYSSAAERYGV